LLISRERFVELVLAGQLLRDADEVRLRCAASLAEKRGRRQQKTDDEGDESQAHTKILGCLLSVAQHDPDAGSLAQVSRDDIIPRSVAHFRKAADAEFGRRVAEGIAARRNAAAVAAR
jgi:hypothetical protein